MRLNTITRMGGVLAAVGLFVAASLSANAALSWTPPITVNDHDIVGAADILHIDPAQPLPADVISIAQNLLDLSPAADTTTYAPDLGRRYRTSSTDFSGALTLAGANKFANGTTHVSGYEYVMAKYDGQNAGWVLFRLNGLEADLPQYSWSIWGGDPGQYGISAVIGFNSDSFTPVPEPTTIIAGALLLLPFGASTVRVLRKKS